MPPTTKKPSKKPLTDSDSTMTDAKTGPTTTTPADREGDVASEIILPEDDAAGDVVGKRRMTEAQRELADEVCQDAFLEGVKILNVYQRLHGLMADLPEATRDGQGIEEGRAYRYVGHEALTRLLRPLLLKWRLMVVPSVSSPPQYKYRTAGQRTQIHTTVVMHIHIVNIDDPKDAIYFDTVGNSLVSGDKGVGISISTAIRQGLMKLLTLPTGDPDIETGSETCVRDASDDPGGVLAGQGVRKVAEAPPLSAKGKLRKALLEWGVKGEDQKRVVWAVAVLVAAQVDAEGNYVDSSLDLIRVFVESQITQKISPADALSKGETVKS